MEWKGDILKCAEVHKNALERLAKKKQVLDAKRPLKSNILNKIQADLSLEWTYNSNNIEGNTLTLQETKMILQDGVTVKGKSLREHFEIHNHEKALHLLYSFVQKELMLSSNTIISLHQMVLRSIEDEWAGRYRTGGVRIVGANFTPPNALRVFDMIEELVSCIKENKLRLNPILLATLFHHRFVWIHPFVDGNGRTIRLAMNLLLIQGGYPPAIILGTDRAKYYQALNLANRGKFNKLSLLMIQAVERSMNIYLGALPGSAYDYEPISEIVKEPNIPYGQEYVSLLARQGKIDAYKEGRNWLTTAKAVKDYVDQK